MEMKITGAIALSFLSITALTGCAATEDKTEPAVVTTAPVVVVPTPAPTQEETTNPKVEYYNTLVGINSGYANVSIDEVVGAGEAICTMFGTEGVEYTLLYFSQVEDEQTRTTATQVIPAATKYLCPEYTEELKSVLTKYAD